MSAGYLRRWGRDRKPGKSLVRLLSKDGTIDRIVPVEKVLWRRGFLTAAIDGEAIEELEDQFAELEREVLPVVARVAAGEWDPAWHVALKILAALHLARSFRFREMYEKSAEEQFAGPLAGMSESALRSAFHNDHGRAPIEGELEKLVGQYVKRWYDSNAFFVNEVARIYNKALDMFKDLHLQIVRAVPWAPDLVTGDTPLVLTDETRLNVRMAIGDTSLAYLPLGRRAGMLFVTGAADARIVTIAPTQAQELNNLVWRAASRFVVAHPETDLARSLAMRWPPQQLATGSEGR